MAVHCNCRVTTMAARRLRANVGSSRDGSGLPVTGVRAGALPPGGFHIDAAIASRLGFDPNIFAQRAVGAPSTSRSGRGRWEHDSDSEDGSEPAWTQTRTHDGAQVMSLVEKSDSNHNSDFREFLTNEGRPMSARCGALGRESCVQVVA